MKKNKKKISLNQPKKNKLLLKIMIAYWSLSTGLFFGTYMYDKEHIFFFITIICLIMTFFCSYELLKKYD